VSGAAAREALMASPPTRRERVDIEVPDTPPALRAQAAATPVRKQVAALFRPPGNAGN
jgi:hypothetical protein